MKRKYLGHYNIYDANMVLIDSYTERCYAYSFCEAFKKLETKCRKGAILTDVETL